jgi:hypothetical protein
MPQQLAVAHALGPHFHARCATGKKTGGVECRDRISYGRGCCCCGCMMQIRTTDMDGMLHKSRLCRRACQCTHCSANVWNGWTGTAAACAAATMQMACTDIPIKAPWLAMGGQGTDGRCLGRPLALLLTGGDILSNLLLTGFLSDVTPRAALSTAVTGWRTGDLEIRPRKPPQDGAECTMGRQLWRAGPLSQLLAAAADHVCINALQYMYT